MEELNNCTLFNQTSLPPNHPTTLKVKNVHNFAIFKRICMKLCMEALNVKFLQTYRVSDLLVIAILWNWSSLTPLRRGPRYCSDFSVSKT